MNPVLPVPFLTLICALVLAIAAAGAWRGSVGLTGGVRGSLLALRLAAVAALALLLFNPGRWVNPAERAERPWLLLADVSESMKRDAGDGKTRAGHAAEIVRQTTAQAQKAGVPLRVHPFSNNILPPVAELPAPAGETKILPAVSQAIQDASAAGESLAGLIVASDGRQTSARSAADLDALALRARSLGLAIHTVAIGGAAAPPDLALVQPRASLTAFAGQPVRIPFVLRSEALPPLRPVVVLRDESGAEIANVTVELAANSTAAAAFDVAAPAASARWMIETPPVPDEVRRSNNTAAVHIRVLESKTRVFLAEGAPYWDSKFLAQLLRQQTHMDVRSIHRLTDERYFRIDTGDNRNEETDHPVFPDTLEELARYDLVVFGKNVDPFLTDERAGLLRAYVRDHGGAVLFARGKPTTSAAPALEALEPVVWSAARADSFRFAPNRDGEASGLFGQALPAPDASLWASLPPLKDGRQVSMVKPFTRVLADGVPETGGNLVSTGSGRFPVLMVRRYGQGVTGLVNGDGLWKWDFFPEARELGNSYEDFWIQLIQWMASYSEFLPGQDFSLRLPSSRGDEGATVAATISYRGPQPVPQPLLETEAPDGSLSTISPAAVSDASGRPQWRASFAPDRAGTWKLRVVDPRETAPPVPEALFAVPAPVTEDDDLSPDPLFLTSISEATGGDAVVPAAYPGFLVKHITAAPPATRESGAVWKPAWRTAYAALALALLFAAEWFLRRRNGLA